MTKVQKLEAQLADEKRELAESQAMRKAQREQIETLQETVRKTKAENTRLAARLDAALYSMVLMQGLIRQLSAEAPMTQNFKFNEAEKRWENLSTPHDDLKLAV